jgi:hypothetical protein
MVADLGTVSKAALRLRISQSALSRQIADLEYECGFKLFDRIGRRLFLTTRGEEVLADCRGVLGQIGSLTERVELLKRGDSGVLKLAAPPQTCVECRTNVRFTPKSGQIAGAKAVAIRSTSSARSRAPVFRTIEMERARRPHVFRRANSIRCGLSDEPKSS